MPECEEGFCKILLALWATWFISFVYNVFHEYCLFVVLKKGQMVPNLTILFVALVIPLLSIILFLT
jgi:hypothetical protein